MAAAWSTEESMGELAACTALLTAWLTALLAALPYWWPKAPDWM